MAREWTKDEIRAKLETSDAFVERALLALYEHQTYDEQLSLTTSHDNGIGFNGVDAPIMSKFAEWVKKSSWPEGKRLSHKMRVITRKKLMKYAGQLVIIAEKKAKAAEKGAEAKAVGRKEPFCIGSSQD